jgi:predicted metal-dependent hydrolase
MRGQASVVAVERQICINQQLVAYTLKRSTRRSLGFLVSAQGLRVLAPNWLAERDIEAALHAKAAWIAQKLAEQRTRALNPPAGHPTDAAMAWQHGAELAYLGGVVRLAVSSSPAISRASATLTDNVLCLELPPGAAPPQIQAAVEHWLKTQALHVFQARCAHFAPQLQVRPQRLSLSAARTRWGSASASGNIRLNWRLIHLPLPTLDYVVVHELAHLREMNHSARFWSLVRAVLPDYETTRRGLQHAPAR